mgnify:CR=1 FL=1
MTRIRYKQSEVLSQRQEDVRNGRYQMKLKHRYSKYKAHGVQPLKLKAKINEHSLLINDLYYYWLKLLCVLRGCIEIQGWGASLDHDDHHNIVDLFIIGGGINGCGIARDAAGRGLSVELAEMNDLASATSSASTKLFHGGLRYLEYWEIRLVREALIERETLLRAMPHISWPM